MLIKNFWASLPQEDDREAMMPRYQKPKPRRITKHWPSKKSRPIKNVGRGHAEQEAAKRH